jgi:hypothetical protein
MKTLSIVVSAIGLAFVLASPAEAAKAGKQKKSARARSGEAPPDRRSVPRREAIIRAA